MRGEGEVMVACNDDKEESVIEAFGNAWEPEGETPELPPADPPTKRMPNAPFKLALTSAFPPVTF